MQHFEGEVSDRRHAGTGNRQGREGDGTRRAAVRASTGARKAHRRRHQTIAAHSGTTALTGNSATRHAWWLRQTRRRTKTYASRTASLSLARAEAQRLRTSRGAKKLQQRMSQRNRAELDSACRKGDASNQQSRRRTARGGAFGAGDNTNIATAPCDTLTNFAAAATSSPLKDSTEVHIGPWWKMTGAREEAQPLA
ncbi:hypothetical protein ERJ75_000118900 [Trypanosoma vivax]|nr:hypothetical protein ERJ75_000118900 [Trypanosoma vivax]